MAVASTSDYRPCSGLFHNGSPRLLTNFEKYRTICKMCQYSKDKEFTMGICKTCGNEHDTYYGNGIFCSSSCARSYSSKFGNTPEKRLQKSESVKKTGRAYDTPEYRVRVGQGVMLAKAKKAGRECDISKVVPRILREIECPKCNITFKQKTTRQIFCSKACVDEHHRTDGRYKCVAAGIASSQAQQRRSKNEILFAELCAEHFGQDDILTNEPIFEKWDADVVIKSLKVAVLWNGIWHYQQVRQDHSLLQVQTRDHIKEKVITKCGYQYYIVKDMGKYDPKFVRYCFEAFLQAQLSPDLFQ